MCSCVSWLTDLQYHQRCWKLEGLDEHKWCKQAYPSPPCIKHKKTYHDTVITNALKYSDAIAASRLVKGKGVDRRPQEPFTLEGLECHLARWIVADDQVMPIDIDRATFSSTKADHIFQALNSIECPEWRDLMLYLGQDYITEEDLPHRSKLKKLITREATRSFERLIHDLEVSSSYKFEC